MKLLLTSGGLRNKTIIDALLSLTGRPFSELNVTFVPTAANVEKGDKDWLIDDLIRLTNLAFKSIDIVDISAVPKDIWLPRLEFADIIFVEGGNTFHLMYWMERSGLKDLLPGMLEKKVYVGVSAGSMVMCKSLEMSTSKKLYYEDAPQTQKDEGMGLVDYLIRPHLNSEYFKQVTLENLEQYAKKFPDTFYALDDESAIKVIDGRSEVISEGVWKKFN